MPNRHRQLLSYDISLKGTYVYTSGAISVIAIHLCIKMMKTRSGRRLTALGGEFRRLTSFRLCKALRARFWKIIHVCIKSIKAYEGGGSERRGSRHRPPTGQSGMGVEKDLGSVYLWTKPHRKFAPALSPPGFDPGNIRSKTT
jgi:hypothetical protein